MRIRLVVKTGSAKTKIKTKTSSVKTKTKTEVFETKTANGSMKQNAHSSCKNYFYKNFKDIDWCQVYNWVLHLANKQSILICKKNRKQIDGQIHGRSWEIFKTDPLRPRPRPRPQVSRPRPRPPVSRPRPRPGKIGLECSRDQDRGLEDYIPAKKCRWYLQTTVRTYRK